MPQKNEHKHVQDESEIEDKTLEKKIWFSPGPDILTDKKLCSESSLYSVEKSSSPTGTADIRPVSTKQSTANLLSYPTEGMHRSLTAGYMEGLPPNQSIIQSEESEEQKQVIKAEWAMAKAKKQKRRRIHLLSKRRLQG